jgi:hypothetical protein
MALRADNSMDGQLHVAAFFSSRRLQAETAMRTNYPVQNPNLSNNMRLQPE